VFGLCDILGKLLRKIYLFELMKGFGTFYVNLPTYSNN
jgi:hypothetical protein